MVRPIREVTANALRRSQPWWAWAMGGSIRPAISHDVFNADALGAVFIETASRRDDVRVGTLAFAIELGSPEVPAAARVQISVPSGR